MDSHSTFWQIAWKQFSRHRLGVVALAVVSIFILVGIYAPLLASSKPLAVKFNGEWYFPLFRYLFYSQFFTKPLDIFYNLLMFTLPVFICTAIFLRRFHRLRRWMLIAVAVIQGALFIYFIVYPFQDPAFDDSLIRNKKNELQSNLELLKETPLLATPRLISWNDELRSMNTYAQLNLILRYRQFVSQQQRLAQFEEAYHKETKVRNQSDSLFPTLWNLSFRQEKNDEENQQRILKELNGQYLEAKETMALVHQVCHPDVHFAYSALAPIVICDFLNSLSNDDINFLFKKKNVINRYEKAQARLLYLKDRQQWLNQQSNNVQYEIMPLLRPFHWEDDAGGDQLSNRLVSWWDLTRINRKDMVASLIFGVRISLSVGFLAIGLALLIGIPIGAVAGYYGGKIDLVVYRLIEIWESMPTIFMLLMVVAFLQSKSIFLIIAVIGLFGWTGFSRFIRGEFFRQKQLTYVEACRAMGYSDRRIIFTHLLPNAIPPLLTLVPFAIMGAITNEAALSFLGLGEEGSNSWGILMDEGRSAFPAESYLLWPPAILLTILLVSIAIIGDSLRDALDPKLHIRES